MSSTWDEYWDAMENLGSYSLGGHGCHRTMRTFGGLVKAMAPNSMTCMGFDWHFFAGVRVSKATVPIQQASRWIYIYLYKLPECAQAPGYTRVQDVMIPGYTRPRRVPGPLVHPSRRYARAPGPKTYFATSDERTSPTWKECARASSIVDQKQELCS